MHVDAFLLYLCHRFDPLNNKYMTFQKQKNRCINSSLLWWSGLHNQCTSGFGPPKHFSSQLSPAVVTIGAASPPRIQKYEITGKSAWQKEIKPWNNTQADSVWACVCFSGKSRCAWGSAHLIQPRADYCVLGCSNRCEITLPKRCN